MTITSLPRSTTLAIASLLGCALPAHSQQLSANAEAAYLGSETPVQTATSGSVSDTDSGPGDFGEPRYEVNTATATFGTLRASSMVGIVPRTSSFPYSALGQSTASFTDDFLIFSPELNGTAGTVTVRFTIDGTLSIETTGTPDSSSATSNTFAEASYAFGVGIDASHRTATDRLRYDGTHSGTPFLGITQEHILPFTFGDWTNDVTLRITTVAVAAGQGSYYTSEVQADLSHTAIWGGFVEVRDASGNLVTNYSFSSASGVNYTQAIPEPGSASLLVLGAVVLLGRRRSQRARMRG